MKKFFSLISEKAVLLTFVFAACCVCFVSCGDDDDEGPAPETGIGQNAPYYGTWQVSYYKLVEDGENFEGSVSAGQVLKLTLNENGTFEYYVYISDEDGIETYTDKGTWSYSKNTIHCVADNHGYIEVGDMLVQSWTPSQLVTKIDFGDGSYEVRTWKHL